MREYERTHPWISFDLDLGRASPKFWMMLGEIQSKCEHIAGVPLMGDVAKRLHQVFLAKGVLATTAIEGNTLTEEEVARRIQGLLDLPPSKDYLGREIDNVVDGCNEIRRRIIGGEDGILTTAQIMDFNRRIMSGLPDSVEKLPGEIRTVSVGVGRYRGAPAEDCEYLVDRLCEWMNQERQQAPADMKIAMGVVRAILAHLYLVWIHPFNDGNGRTARMMELQILLDVAVPTPAAHLLSNHYNQTRSEYYRMLDRSSSDNGNAMHFVMYALQGMLDGLRSQIDLIRDFQWDVAWREHVYAAFKTIPGTGESVRVRRRDLILALSNVRDPVAVPDLRKISPEVAEAYAGRSIRMLSRDVEALVEMGLVEVSPSGARAARESILRFLPGRAER